MSHFNFRMEIVTHLISEQYKIKKIDSPIFGFEENENKFYLKKI